MPLQSCLHLLRFRRRLILVWNPRPASLLVVAALAFFKVCVRARIVAECRNALRAIASRGSMANGCAPAVGEPRKRRRRA